MYTNIDTVEKAYQVCGLDPKVRPEVTNAAPQFVGLLEKIHDAVVVSEAIREGWVPDYQDNNPKWESWYKLRKDDDNPSGFRFRCSAYTYTCTASVLGPLLCQETEEKDIFFQKTFTDLLGQIANHPLLYKLNSRPVKAFSYTDIKTVEDAYNALGIAQHVRPITSALDSEIANAMQKSYDLMIVSKAIREGWVPDYENADQSKWEGCFDLNTDENNPSGFRFYCSCYANSSAFSVLGPLLCQETKAKSDYFCKQFEELHREALKPRK